MEKDKREKRKSRRKNRKIRKRRRKREDWKLEKPLADVTQDRMDLEKSYEA